ncbi:AAA family ATPase [Paenibacillus illinoisensis]|uniref:AAA family ATPase n=1 Tax=Paenibacillus illinoisensis TaxID=59845 RepID=UPI0036F3B5B4
MKRLILITGMSGTGKSTALAELARKGYRVVDTDYGEWSEHTDSTGWLWNEERITALLTGHNEGALFISGTVSNQGKFYPLFDAIVLLSAPLPKLSWNEYLPVRIILTGRPWLNEKRSFIMCIR